MACSRPPQVAESGPPGAHLGRRFGDAFVNRGFAFDAGSFQSMDCGPMHRGLIPLTEPGAPPGSFDHTPARTGFAALAILATCASCTPRDMTAEFLDERRHSFSFAERRAIASIADATAREVKRLLPTLPAPLVLKVNPGDQVIAETGETGTSVPPNIVYWTVDPARRGGVESIAGAQLRATLFHELHHLARQIANPHAREALLDHVVTEGLATVFERDAAGAPVPWGEPPADVESWLAELLALPPATPRGPWMFRHPDGRRWIGFKVGVYVVDRAARFSGRSPAALVATSTAEILQMARLDRP